MIFFLRSAPTRVALSHLQRLALPMASLEPSFVLFSPENRLCF
jgi:hypothetical protein